MVEKGLKRKPLLLAVLLTGLVFVGLGGAIYWLTGGDLSGGGTGGGYRSTGSSGAAQDGQRACSPATLAGERNSGEHEDSRVSSDSDSGEMKAPRGERSTTGDRRSTDSIEAVDDAGSPDELPTGEWPESGNGESEGEDTQEEEVEFEFVITGRVTDSQDVAVAGARVVPSLLMVREDATKSTVRADWIAVTDEYGYFCLKVRHSVHVDSQIRVEVKAMSNGFADSATLSLRLESGDVKEGVKLVLFDFGVITGRVTDTEGNGKEGVTVEVARTGSKFAAHQEVATDEYGSYRIEGVSEGTYFIWLKSYEHRVRSGPKLVVVVQGVVENFSSADFMVDPATSIRVYLAEEDGKAVSGSVAFAIGSSPIHRVISAQKTPGGKWVIWDPPLGELEIKIMVGGYRTHTCSIAVAEGQSLDLGRVVLEPTDSGEKRGDDVSGEVAAYVSGTVTDADGSPVPGAAVVSRKVELDEIAAQVTCDSAGQFSLQIRLQGNRRLPLTIKIRASALGYADSGDVFVVVGNGDNKHVSLAVRLQGAVAGRVVDAEGRGFKGAMITIHGPGNRTETARSSKSGDFGFEIAGEGRYRISATAPGHSVLNGPSLIYVDPHGEAQLPVNFVVVAVTSFKVKLVDREGNPLKGTPRFYLWNSSADVLEIDNVSLDDDGVAVVGNVMEGAVSCSISLSGHASVTVAGEFKGGSIHDFGALSLEPNLGD